MSVKPRTVRAWAIYCADGGIHEYYGGESYRLLVYEQKSRGKTDGAAPMAKFMRDHPDVPDWNECGPHRVVTLTGTFTPKEKRGKRG